MVREHQKLDGHESEEPPGNSEEQLQSMGLQRVRLDLVTEQQQIYDDNAIVLESLIQCH